MTNRTKMLEFTLDDSEDEQPDHPTTIIVKPKAADRFQSASVTRGLFASQQEDEIEYVNVPVRVPRKDSSKKTEEKVKIKMVHEVQYEQEELNQQPTATKAAKNDSRGEEQPSNQIKQQDSASLECQFVKAPIFSHRMLEIALSESSESSNTDGREGQPQQQQQNQDAQYQSHQTSKSNPQKLEISALLQGVNDIKSFLKQFSLKPVGPGKVLSLVISRNSSGLNNFWPEFQVMYENGENLLYSKKMMGSTTSNYYITAEPGIESISHPSFIAKLRSNFSGSLYHVFDNGVNPEKANKINKARSIQATIKFKSQIMTMEPRSFEVFVLREGVAYEQLDGVVPMKEIGLDELFLRQQNRGKIVRFMNRRPAFSQKFKGYILNFSGRVQKPSIKNFILEDVDGDKKEVVMLGKTSDDIYRLDISCPMPPYLALGVCLANFDSKFLSD